MPLVLPSLTHRHLGSSLGSTQLHAKVHVEHESQLKQTGWLQAGAQRRKSCMACGRWIEASSDMCMFFITGSMAVAHDTPRKSSSFCWKRLKQPWSHNSGARSCFWHRLWNSAATRQWLLENNMAPNPWNRHAKDYKGGCLPETRCTCSTFDCMIVQPRSTTFFLPWIKAYWSWHLCIFTETHPALQRCQRCLLLLWTFVGGSFTVWGPPSTPSCFN